jgi:hypothetical protein
VLICLFGPDCRSCRTIGLQDANFRWVGRCSLPLGNEKIIGFSDFEKAGYMRV